MPGDFAVYLDKGFVLIRPENPTARGHLEQNVAEYEKWLFKFYFPNGSSILFGPGPGGGIYVKPKADLDALTHA